MVGYPAAATEATRPFLRAMQNPMNRLDRSIRTRPSKSRVWYIKVKWVANPYKGGK